MCEMVEISINMALDYKKVPEFVEMLMRKGMTLSL